MARKQGNRLLTPAELDQHISDVLATIKDPESAIEVKEQAWPSDWLKGQLLNVRNAGGKYCVTLLGEEFDSRKPERALHFENAFDCQHFVSFWYSRGGSRP